MCNITNGSHRYFPKGIIESAETPDTPKSLIVHEHYIIGELC